MQYAKSYDFNDFKDLAFAEFKSLDFKYFKDLA